jgi:hypothetical protein
MADYFFRFAALFCFSAASFGFIYFKWRYARRSRVRVWGIRVCHGLGFMGLLMQVLWAGGPNQITWAILIALSVSLFGFELSERLLD